MTHGSVVRRLGFPKAAWLFAFVLLAAPAAGFAQQPPLEGALSPQPLEPREQLAQPDLTPGEQVLFGIHRGVSLIVAPLVEFGVQQHLLGGGSGRVEGFKIKPGSLGSNSGVGLTLGYVVYPAPVWAGISAGISTKGYMEHSAFLGVRDRRGANYLRATGAYDLDPEDEFSGFGMTSPENAETDYRQEEIRFIGDGQVAAGEYFRIGARAGYRKNNLLVGKNDNVDNTEDVFGDTLVGGLPIPGLPRETDKYSQFGGFLALDTRNDPSNPDRGVLLGGSFDAFRGVDDTPFDWDRWAGEFAGYLPLPNETRVIAVRGLVVHQEPKNGQVLVPVYYLSSLGGSSFLRSFSSFRFQDNDLLYGAFEFRRRVWTEKQGQAALDASLFVETAGIYRDITDSAELGDMEQSFGTELRLLVPNDVIARFGVAVGSSEGAKVYLGGGGRF